MQIELDKSGIANDAEALLAHMTELENGSALMARKCGAEIDKILSLATNDAAEQFRMVEALKSAKDDFEVVNRLATSLMNTAYPRLQRLIAVLNSGT